MSDNKNSAPFRIGQRVRIINEQLYNVPGVVKAIDSVKSQVRVTVNFFGQEYRAQARLPGSRKNLAFGYQPSALSWLAES